MLRRLVFAYGSNMHPERMLARVPGAEPQGAARLSGHRLALNKRGRDGSAKANLVRAPDGLVWGVLWSLTVEEVCVLDGHEGGYTREAVRVHAATEARDAEAYVSTRLVADALPYDWYLDHLLHGARAFDFPPEYLEWLAAQPSQPGEREA